MRRLLPLAGALAALGILLAGCGKSPVNAPKQPDPIMNTAAAQARVASILAAAPQVIEDQQIESNEVAALSGGGTGALSVAGSVRFWRTITHVERSYDFAFSDPDSAGNPRKAIVTVHKTLTGQFNIATPVPATDSTADSVVIVRKPLEDHWVRRLQFVRIPHPDSTSRDSSGNRIGRSAVACGDTSSADNDWRLVGTSGVSATSQGAVTRIVSLRLQAGGLDTTFTDPLALYRLRSVLRFDPGTQLTLTATTLRNDDVVVFLLHRHRVRFTNNGDNTYTGVLLLPDDECRPSLRHIGVNALSNGTLFDNQAPYDSQAWVLPFMVKPNLLPDDLH